MKLLKEGKRTRYSKRIKKGGNKGRTFNYDTPQTHNRKSSRKNSI
jgi:hypothetical protein